MEKTDVLILGAGLAGLSCGYHLKKSSPSKRFLILEKNSRPGGLAGSFQHEGFTFDHTGHLLHLHDPYGKKLILGLLKGNLSLHKRNSWIYSHEAYTRYPFQANTYGLPREIVTECVAEFLKSSRSHPSVLSPQSSSLSFKDWCLKTFGAGISRHFMFPYNQKLWLHPLDQMTTEWQGRFVPRPKKEEVLYGALMDQKKFFGYNAAFRYPKKGGTQALPDSFSRQLPEIRCNAEVKKIDLREKTVVAEGVGEIRYGTLVNTMPLIRFLDCVQDLPQSVQECRARLLYNSVYCLNLGIAREKVSDKHWIYFPESRYPFYRVGFYSNFSRAGAPRGTSSLYIEVSRKPHEKVNLDVLESQVLEGLKQCGLMKYSDKIAARLWTPIKCAYVIYDFNRTPAVETIFKFLAENRAESIGRYGAWKYSFMEEAVLDGKRCAEKLLGKKTSALKSQEELLSPRGR